MVLDKDTRNAGQIAINKIAACPIEEIAAGCDACLEYWIIQSRYDGHWIRYSLGENCFHFVAAQAHQAAHQATSAHCIDRSNGRSDSYRANAFPYL
ncbi:unnamed protein product [Danaus chrysippus]|uniref:(African queen) hypothetical protein n=1 Tax=Danaus chrysippus TaxID=151541 RepID=A0A8J2QSP1_9NEOP|nr:unnamed protein product [Danaus chrysippus]